MVNVAILLSTFNGEKYLNEQLDSILLQSFEDWHLYIRDDGSTDETVEIIKCFKSFYPNKVTIVASDVNLGAAKSFFSLLELADSNYYMFCDQDDVWLPSKIEKSLRQIQSFESSYGNSPLLSFCDAIIVDKNLITKNDSFWRYSKIHPRKVYFKDNLILYFNVAPGCTMLFNKQLRDICISIYPSVNIIHDHLISILAMKHGRILFVEDALIKYRQHENNQIGAVEIKKEYFELKLKKISSTLLKQIEQFKMINKFKKMSCIRYYINKIYFNVKRANDELQ